MNYSIAGYDNWKLASPYDNEPEFPCENCGCEVPEIVAEETEFCEDCLCDDECEGCIYCLSVTGYNEAEGNGTLKTEPTN